MLLINKKRFGLFLIIIGLLLAYLLWPLSSDKHPIHFDKEKIAVRESFLRDHSKEEQDLTQLPNILLIVADDLGKTDISHYGSPFIHTPNIDAIGQNGVTFEEGYITSPICSPSRAGLMTGRYQQRFGYEYIIHERYPKNRLEYLAFKYFVKTGNWLVNNNPTKPSQEHMHKQGLPLTEITLAELLQKQGYQTAIIGKWHLGYSKDLIPNNRGFHYQYGFYEAYSLYAPPDKPGIVNQKHDFDFSDQFIWKKGRKGTSALRRNDKIIEEDEYLTPRIAEEATQFMEKHQNKPFFLYVPFSAPHTPFQATQEHFDQLTHISDRNKRVYYAMIAALDEAVGKIMDKLKELELEENTLVFFISDNGGATYTRATDNAPLKGGKFTNFEGGVNVPFMMQWKGQIPASTHYKAPVSALDIFATSAAASSSKLPDDRPFDGTNLIPHLNGQKISPPHKALYWRTGKLKAIRKDQWKLIIDEESDNAVLYNLNKDKTEQKNLLEKKPAVVKDLLEDLNVWEKQLVSPLWPHVMKFRFKTEDGDFYFPL
ncbi:sulfatase-like hydrolase/transferase [Xanthovirga aplysinae]|uniref:sulfatase-like hydrolase/transferase n=1 Tax=Xanthovirga aplysinae TaxID=2529853 RepID=UPI0012BCBE42|nr:sulfatase-like hydrolase/transferase [Xanthovirga aplysinae]MTI31486.1 sulfatase [Xanthovirga aplysinae]